MAMSGRRIIGKLCLVGAGGGCLALAMFVVQPWLTARVEAPGATGSEEIVEEVLSLPATDEADQGDRDDADEEGGMPAPSPLVGLRDNGEEVAVVFPAAGGNKSQEETPEAGDLPADEEREAVQRAPAEGLPPVLSPEDVAAAMALLQDGSEESGGPADAGAAPAGSPEHAWDVKAHTGQPEAVIQRDTVGGHQVEAPLPPPSATRDVQDLLQALGYQPGPVDGVWGPLTAGAWRRFARDAADLAARGEHETSQPERAAEPPAAESPATSGEAVAPGGSGTGQAGSPRPGLPPQEGARPVAVPATLRGIMGYRMPAGEPPGGSRPGGLGGADSGAHHLRDPEAGTLGAGRPRVPAKWNGCGTPTGVSPNPVSCQRGEAGTR